MLPLHHALCQWVSLCFHCITLGASGCRYASTASRTQYELQSYQRQTSDQPAKNNGTLYQLSVPPVVPPCLATTHFQQGNQCTHSVILNVMFKLLLQWESCDYCTFWVCVFCSYVSGMQYARDIIIHFISGCTIFATLSQKRQDFRMEMHLTLSMCFDILYKFFLNICNSE
jgi:hypothetical protein